MASLQQGVFTYIRHLSTLLVLPNLLFQVTKQTKRGEIIFCGRIFQSTKIRLSDPVGDIFSASSPCTSITIPLIFGYIFLLV